MADLPPDWAIERVCRLVKGRSTLAGRWTAEEVRAEHQFGWAQAVIIAAEIIAKHEQPPVDPLLECLRETFGGCAPEFFAAFKEGLVKRGLQVTPL